MAVTKLQLYNLALSHLKERPLASLSEGRKPRRSLDAVYDLAIGYCLERHMWNFMYRTVVMDASDSVLPAFGFLYAFPIPNDWIRTRKVSAVETLDPPLLQMSEEAGVWYANITPIYVQYNSNDPTYGKDFGLWPASFTTFVALRLATQSCVDITGSDKLLLGPQGLMKREERARREAASICAMNDPVGFAPMSSWVRARRGLVGGRGADSPTGGALIP